MSQPTRYLAPEHRFGGKHAVVIGGSMAGMLASRVLAHHFEQVTLIERDALAGGAEHRKGVPQAQHAHGILAKAVSILEELFPGLFKEIVDGGGTATDMSELAWFHSGAWNARALPGLGLYIQSRSFLDGTVRRRLADSKNIRVVDGCEVTRLITSEDRLRVTGVELHYRPGAGQDGPLSADLVVDASGRGSRMPRWLKELGYPEVEETTLRVDVAYASRFYRRPPGLVSDWKVIAIYPKPPHEKRMGTVTPVEGDRWLVSLAGCLGDHPPTDEQGFLEFARSLPQPQVHEAITNAEPLSPIVLHKFPSNLRRHYDRMARFPEGLAVLGDSLCSFNPLYGQGMTLAALGAVSLGESLAEQPRAQLAGLAARFRKKVAPVLELPWIMATGEDLLYPEVEGPRPWWWHMMHGYANRLHGLAAHDPLVSTGFAKVMHMTTSPLLLASPPFLLRVLHLNGAPAAPASAPLLRFTAPGPL